jgi:hypothetical protein
VLLPARGEGDSVDGEYRPEQFMVGSREFDPIKVGFKGEGYNGFIFETNQRGDRNSGHEYGTIHDSRVKAGKALALTQVQRWELVEYLKTL